MKWDLWNLQVNNSPAWVTFLGQLSFIPSVLVKRSLLHGSLHHGQVFESMAPVLLRFISRPKELDLPLFGFDFIFVLLQFLLSSNVWVSHRLRERDEGEESANSKMTARNSDVCVWIRCVGVHHTCMALWRLRAARLTENSFWTEEKARENRSSPTCLFSSSISSCARFFSVGSG